jgi:hypothetical protein
MIDDVQIDERKMVRPGYKIAGHLLVTDGTIEETTETT